MSIIDTVIAAAEAQIGKPYIFGDEGPNSFDCSGLMQYVYGLAGIKLPRLAHEQQNVTTPVSTPAPGDLVFWGRPAYHVALYIGGGKIIAAPDAGEKVKIQNIWGQPSGYGRVKGSGAGTADLLGGITGGLSNLGSSLAGSTLGQAVAPLLSGVKNIAYTVGFAGLGLGLLVVGGLAIAAPALKKKTNEIVEAVT